jgi:hypothetical protein
VITDEPRATTPATGNCPSAKMRLQIRGLGAFLRRAAHEQQAYPVADDQAACGHEDRVQVLPGVDFVHDQAPEGDKHQGDVQGDTDERYLAEVRGQLLGEPGIPPPDRQANEQGQQQESQQRFEQVPGVHPACGTFSKLSIQGSTSVMNGIVTTSKMRDMEAA